MSKDQTLLTGVIKHSCPSYAWSAVPDCQKDSITRRYNSVSWISDTFSIAVHFCSEVWLGLDPSQKNVGLDEKDIYNNRNAAFLEESQGHFFPSKLSSLLAPPLVVVPGHLNG